MGLVPISPKTRPIEFIIPLNSDLENITPTLFFQKPGQKYV
jgi:hypothetical protein